MRTAFSALLLLLLSGTATHSMAEEVLLEHKVKASYLVNFIRFIQWPTDSFANAGDNRFKLCVIGDDPLLPLLRRFDGRNIKGRRIELVVPADAESACHMTYIGLSEEGALPRWLQLLESRNTLTVSDAQGFAQAGGMLGFSLEEGRVTVEINVGQINRAGFEVSAQLLEIAKLVERGKSQRAISIAAYLGGGR